MTVALYVFFFFFNDTATTEIYTLSLHDALPIYTARAALIDEVALVAALDSGHLAGAARSEEHTSELQSLAYLVCRLLLEKKKNHYAPPDDVAPARPRHTPHTWTTRHRAQRASRV